MRVLLHILPPFLARFDKEADETDSSADDEDDGEDDLLLGTSHSSYQDSTAKAHIIGYASYRRKSFVIKITH